MEELSRFGINNSYIRKQYDYVLELEFPEAPVEDEIYDLFSELVQLDGYIMGIVSKYIKTGIVNVNNLNCDSEFMSIYSQLKIQSPELESIMRYKRELDKLIMLFGIKKY